MLLNNVNLIDIFPVTTYEGDPLNGIYFTNKVTEKCLSINLYQHMSNKTGTISTKLINTIEGNLYE